MGHWAKSLFGQEKFDRVGIVFTGRSKLDFEEQMLSLFDKVLFKKDSAYHSFLAEKNKKLYPILTNIYGAPAMIDSLTEMHDGGVRNIIFIGSAYGGLFKANLSIGSYTLPTKAYHFDGIYSPLDPSKTESVPNAGLRKVLKQILNQNNITYTEGSNISVPSVMLQLPHENEHYKKIIPKPITLEMELASCLSRARDLGIRAVAILSISDNRTSHIGADVKAQLRMSSKLNIFKVLVPHLNKFDLPNLKTKREFNINEHLASIIHDPEDENNIYRKK